MLTPLQKDMFTLIEKHFGYYDTKRNINISRAHVEADLLIALVLYARLRKYGSDINAARMINTNRNTVRKYKMMLKGASTKEIIKEGRRAVAEKLGLVKECL